jgi:hypothetical protein
VDLNVRTNRAYPSRNGHQKTLEDTRGHHTKAEPEWLAPHVGRPAPYGPLVGPRRSVGSPPPPRLHLRRPLSRFDPRAHDGRSGLYISALPPSVRCQVI